MEARVGVLLLLLVLLPLGHGDTLHCTQSSPVPILINASCLPCPAPLVSVMELWLEYYHHSNIQSGPIWLVDGSRMYLIVHWGPPSLTLLNLHFRYMLFSRESDSRIANVRLSVSPSVTKTPQPLRIVPISQISAYLCLLAIVPISHNTCDRKGL